MLQTITNNIKGISIIVVAIIAGIFWKFFKSTVGEAAIQKTKAKEHVEKEKESIKEIKEITKKTDVLETNIKNNDIKIEEQTNQIETIINDNIKKLDEAKKEIEESKTPGEIIVKTSNRMDEALKKLRGEK